MDDYQKHSLNSKKDLNISQLVFTILNRKVLILVYILLVTIIVACLFAVDYLKNPATKISELNFSMVFRGANEGLYPNNSRFSEEDIVSTPILQKVYDINSLKNFFGDFSSFKNSITVERYNPYLTFLTYEYKAKLSNKDLSSAERYELEQEFYRLTANIVAKPDFTLACIYDNAHKYNLPDELIGKALGDILSVWSEKAKDKEGATKYKIPMITTPIEQSYLDELDYFTAADYMRLTLLEIKTEIAAIEELPNATNISIKLNNKSYSLKDLNAKSTYSQQFILNPLLDLIQNSRIYKNKTYVQAYIDNKINTLKSSLEAINIQRETYERMMLENIVSSPDQLMKLASQEAEVNREISFYKSFLSVLKENPPQDANLKQIESQLIRLMKSENELIELSYKFYEQACEYNLNRNSDFYKVNSFSSFVSQKNVLKVYLKQSVVVWAFLIAILLVAIVGKEYLGYFLNKYKNSQE
ncbi:MAG: hypothetical protein WCR55_03390 [Lentisphaerota bacterium]